MTLHALDVAFSTEGLNSSPARAGDLSSFVDRAFSAALPYQYLREFVQNSIEANPTEIRLEPDWVFVEDCVARGVDPIYRWSIWDDGDGMDEAELIAFKDVFTSSKGDMRSRRGNFGMGAKVSAYPLNPAGIIVMSWKGGVGRMIILHCDKHGHYSIVHQPRGDGKFDIVLPTPPVYNFKTDTNSREHGTLVIFVGASPDDHTYLKPHVPETETWAVTLFNNVLSLNERYLTLPAGVEITAYVPSSKYIQAWARSRSKAASHLTSGEKSHITRLIRQDEPRGKAPQVYGTYRRVRGAQHHWTEVSTANGSVSGKIDGSSFTVNWWLFEKEEGKPDPIETGGALSNLHAHVPTKSMVGLVHKGEMYNMRRGAALAWLFSRFGIFPTDVRKRMIIMVESEGLVPNDVRSALEMEGAEDVPWDEWGAHFRKYMPAAVQAALDARESVFVDDGSFRKNVISMIKQHLADFHIAGAFAGWRQHLGEKTGVPRGPYRERTKPNMPPKPRGEGPEVVRSPISDPDVPATYSIAGKTLTVFSEHKVITRSVEHWCSQLPSAPPAAIREVVIETFTAVWISLIYGVIAEEGSPNFMREEAEKALSDAALYGVASSPFPRENYIKMRLVGKYRGLDN